MTKDETFYVSVDCEEGQDFYELFQFDPIDSTDTLRIKVSIDAFQKAVGTINWGRLVLVGRNVEMEWIGALNRLLVRGAYGLR